jgi:hypothetical protein
MVLEVFAICMAIIELIVGGSSCVVFYKRRNAFPIQGTSPMYQLTIIANEVFCHALLWIVEYVTSDASVALDLIIQLFFTMTASFYAIFVWKIYYNFRVSEDMNFQDENSWFIKNYQRFGANRSLQLIQILTVLVHFIVAIAFSGGSGAFTTSIQKFSGHGWNLVILIFACGPCVFILNLAFKMRSRADHYYLLKSLFWTTVTAAFTVLIYIISSSFLGSSSKLESLLSTFVVFETLFGLLIFPVIISARYEIRVSGSDKEEMEDLYPPRASLQEGTQVTVTGTAMDEEKRQRKLQKISLRHVLENRELQEKFREFLVSEFSVENILFWLEVESFKQSCQGPLFDRKAGAFKIFDTFCSNASCYEVNLSYPVAQKLLKKIGEIRSGEQQEVDPTIFNEAQEQIYILMESDPLKRFKRTLSPPELEAIKSTMDLKVREM